MRPTRGAGHAMYMLRTHRKPLGSGFGFIGRCAARRGRWRQREQRGRARAEHGQNLRNTPGGASWWIACVNATSRYPHLLSVSFYLRFHHYQSQRQSAIFSECLLPSTELLSSVPHPMPRLSLSEDWLLSLFRSVQTFYAPSHVSLSLFILLPSLGASPPTKYATSCKCTRKVSTLFVARNAPYVLFPSACAGSDSHTPTNTGSRRR